MIKNAEGRVVTVCGGGNAAHVAAGMYSHHGATVNLFLSLERERDVWNAAKDEGITVLRQQEQDQYTGHVHTASTNPANVIPQANLILIIVPAFAHRPILEYVNCHPTTHCGFKKLPHIDYMLTIACFDCINHAAGQLHRICDPVR